MSILLPTLSLLSHKGLRDAVHGDLANLVYANVVEYLDFNKVADVYEGFAKEEDLEVCWAKRAHSCQGWFEMIWIKGI